ncbi:MAG: hypothetical protein KDA33_07140, partial [Phycisphaerales bacterium]|nr:hypothetical protein [Phycisphaerales bacterium]
LLDDGRVLVVGGLFGAGADAETYDPVTQVFTALAGSPSVQRAAVKLGDGRVLLAGSTSTTATIFDPVANAFSNLGPMSSPHGNFPTVTLLADGRVLIAGGQGNLFETAATDFFDPATDLFSAGPDMNRNRGAHAALRLPNGDVLMIGGSDNGTVHDGAEFWDADQNVFVDLPSTLPGPRMALVAVPLEN